MPHPHTTLFIATEAAETVARALSAAGYEVTTGDVANRHAINVANSLAQPDRARDIINNTLIDDCEQCL